MTPYVIRPEIFATVRRCIAESLALSEGEIEADSRLIDDLGCSSLDFLDIAFTIEKEFGLRIPELESNFLTRLNSEAGAVTAEGFLSESALDQLRPWLVSLAALPDTSRLKPGQIFSLITVASICLIVQRRLDAA